jgi:hypothetical protein
MELLGLLEQGARFRPHLIFRVTHYANLCRFERISKAQS